MFYELKFCYQIIEDYYKNTSKQVQIENEYGEINLMDFSYRIFFFGIGPNSEKNFVKKLKKGELHLFDQIKPFLVEIQDDVISHLISSPYYSYLPNNERTIDFYYLPFDGHVSRLGHYYRLLFQIVTYITTQKFLTYDEKYGYIKTLRVQLSNFEQLLLYYNALAWFDEEWREFFTTYKLIKNLPLALADFHSTPEKHFEKEIKELEDKGTIMFEWLE